MEKETLTRRIKNLLLEVRNFELSLIELLRTVTDGAADYAIPLATEAALRSERLTCSLRHLLYGAIGVKKPEYLEAAANIQNITIRENEQMVEIELPNLMPGKQRRMGSEYLTDPLRYILSRYAESKRIKRFENAVICFIHEYDRSLPSRRIMDYDNIEQKQILDVLASFFLKDDGGLFCDTYNTTRLSDSDKTRIFIMPSEHFRLWYFEMDMV